MSSNYKSDYFPHETLTTIIGKPNYETLQRLKKQLKANARSVPSTLGGGQNGLLGLVLDLTEYAIISVVPFVREPYPGALILPPGTTAIQSKMLEDAYKNA